MEKKAFVVCIPMSAPTIEWVEAAISKARVARVPEYAVMKFHPSVEGIGGRPEVHLEFFWLVQEDAA